MSFEKELTADFDSLEEAQKLINQSVSTVSTVSKESNNKNHEEDYYDDFDECDDDGDEDYGDIEIEKLAEEFCNLQSSSPTGKVKKDKVFTKIIDTLVMLLNDENAEDVITRMIEILREEIIVDYLDILIENMVEMKYDDILFPALCKYGKVDQIVSSVELGYGEFYTKHYRKLYDKMQSGVFDYLYKEELITDKMMEDTFLDACKTNKNEYIEMILEVLDENSKLYTTNMYYDGIKLASKKSPDVLKVLLYKLIEYNGKEVKEKIKLVLKEVISDAFIDKNKKTLDIVGEFSIENNLNLDLKKILKVENEITSENYFKIIADICTNQKVQVEDPKNRQLEKEYVDLADKSYKNHIKMIKVNITEGNIDKVKFITNKVEQLKTDKKEFEMDLNDLIMEAYSINQHKIADYLVERNNRLLES